MSRREERTRAERTADRRPVRRRRRLAPWLALAAIVAVVGWMASGMLGRDEPAPPAAAPARAPAAVAVEAAELAAQEIQQYIVSQGAVAPNRQITLRAETAGTVAALPLRRGARVAEGDVVVRLAMGDRAARLEQARAELTQRRRDNEAAERLAESGYVTEARLSETRAELEAARAAVAAIEEEIEDTTIRAPFAGSLNAVPVELGEAVAVGAELAHIVDNDPLKVEVNIAQQNVDEVRAGQSARIAFVNGAERQGTVTFVSDLADPATRTFLVEIQTPNADFALPSGTSVEARLPAGTVRAHFVSPAVLALDADGVLGVKSVDDSGRVRFHAVDIVRAETGGVWISGLPERVRLITIGQGFVAEGALARVMPAPEDALPAAPGAAAMDGAPQGGPPGLPEVDVSPAPVEPADGGTDVPAAAGDAAPPPDAPLAATPGTVAELQRRLNALGYDAGPVDGAMGPRTRTAMQEFQRNAGLPRTAAPTQRLLDALPASARPER